MTHPLSSSTESQALRIGDPEIADWIPVFTGMTKGRYGNDTPLVILNRKRSASDWGSTFLFVIPHLMRDPAPPVILNRKRSASDWGSSWIWIPVFTGMTKGRYGNDTPLVILNRKPSASDWGSTFLFVIPHLMRDPFGLDSRLRENDGGDAGMAKGRRGNDPD